MTARYRMITNRRHLKKRAHLGNARAGLSYWLHDGQDPIDQLEGWARVSKTEFKNDLEAEAADFPHVEDPEHHEREKHLTLFIHGYNNTWGEAARRYQGICETMFQGSTSLGACTLFTWPSNGRVTGYLPDRRDARESADDFADVLEFLYNELLRRQVAAVRDAAMCCRSKISIIAHSMGNFVLQKAMQTLWTRKNQPLLVSLVNQLLMVAADVDNDLFNGGEEIDKDDGDAIANLTYRITALYTGLDNTLGVSAGLKHFGKRRLGRSGLDANVALPDNVWDVDCTAHLEGEEGIHSAYFENAATIRLMHAILRGVDRGVLHRSDLAPTSGM